LHRQEVLEYVLWRVMNLPDYYELPEPLACTKLLDYYKEYNDPVLQFADEIFPVLTWDIVPQNFIYDAYIAWCARNNPSGRATGKFAILDKLREYVKSKYSDMWVYKQGDTRIKKGDNQQPELLIYELNLVNWMDRSYKGNDKDKLCTPVFKNSYKNCFLRSKAKVA